MNESLPSIGVSDDIDGDRCWQSKTNAHLHRARTAAASRRDNERSRALSCSCATAFMSGPSCWRRYGCCCTGCGWRFVIYAVGYGLIGVGLALLRASASTQFLVGVVGRLAGRLRGVQRLALDPGAPRLDYARLRRSVTMPNWPSGASLPNGASVRLMLRPSPPASPESRYSTPVRRGPPSPSDVIGLFPEPGAQR